MSDQAGSEQAAKEAAELPVVQPVPQYTESESKVRAELHALERELRSMISSVHSRLTSAEHYIHGHVHAVEDVIHARVDALENEVEHFAEKVHARIGSVL